MTRIILFILLGNMILYGLYLFLNSDLKDLKDTSSQKNKILIGINIVATIVGAIYVERFDALLILLMLVDGNVHLIGEKQSQVLTTIMKTVGYALFMVFAELMGTFFYGRYLESKGLDAERFSDNLLINLLMGMCLLSLLLLYVHQVICIKISIQRIMWILVTLKIVEELFGAHEIVIFPLVNGSSIHNAALCIPFLFADYMIYHFLRFKCEEKRLQAIQNDIQANPYEYYMHLEEEQRKIRKLYHDMKNQIMIYENEKGLKEVFEPMMENIKSMSKFYNTGSPALDMLLFNGNRMAAEKGIEFEATVSEGCFDFMAENDISVVFSNALMNAVEACEKVISGPKKIQIKAGVNQEDVMLYVKNTASAERKKGSFATNKGDKKFHGIGLTSIRETVEKYDGYVSIIDEEKSVQLAVIFVGKGRNEKNQT